MSKFNFDFVIIGGGGAGITAALTANGMGKKIAITERRQMGGECTWYGCVPSKAFIKAAHIAREIEQASRYGLEFFGEFKIDTGNVMNYPSQDLSGRRLLLGVTGGIAAYKSAYLCRLFIRQHSILCGLR